MTVIQFPRSESASAAGAWRASEVERVTEASAEPMSRGDVSGWETGVTESGDPQLYLLGPAPGRECVICLSRLGTHYVLEDGQGRILFEHDAIDVLAEQVRGTLRRKTGAIVARATVAWIAFREAFEEKMEPAMAEPTELVSLMVPKFAALI